MKIESVENIKRRFRFKNEWLLIGVKKTKNSKPVTGWLIGHSSDRTLIYKEIAKYNSKYPVFVSFSQEDLPKGYAAAFNICV